MASKHIEKLSMEQLNNGIQSSLNGAMSLVPGMSENVKEVKTKKTTATTATYELVTPIGKKSEYLVTDGGLIRSIEIIKRAMWIQRVVGYATCREFARIEDSGKLEEMGISKISEFGKAFFGLEPSTVNHYARIGRMFIEDVLDENGNVTGYKVKDGLPMLSISHFVELNAYATQHGVDAVVELYVDGELTDGMPVKKLREKLKELESTIALDENGKPELPDASTAENGETVSTETTETTDTTDTTETADSTDTQDGTVNSNIVVAHIMEAINVIRANASLLGWNDEWYIPYVNELSRNAENFMRMADYIE